MAVAVGAVGAVVAFDVVASNIFVSDVSKGGLFSNMLSVVFSIRSPPDAVTISAVVSIAAIVPAVAVGPVNAVTVDSAVAVVAESVYNVDMSLKFSVSKFSE